MDKAPLMSCRACVDRVPMSEHWERAADLALAERLDNGIVGSDGAALLPSHAAAQTSSLWQPGRVLRIGFAPSSSAQRAVVLHAAALWQAHANITFQYVLRGPCEVRVTFNEGEGSWSFIGTDILTIPQNEHTMNIGWGPDLGTCLHELGHTLGLIHEHQNPDANIPWNVQAVLDYYSGPPNYWSAEMIQTNVLDKYNASLITNGGFDPHSIMEYPIPAELLIDKSRAVGWNTTLSPGDIQFIRRIYPGRAA